MFDSFYGINSEIEGFALASYVVQLASEITGEGVSAEEVLRMTLNTLYAIEHDLKPLPLIKSAYEIFAADESGIAPDVASCADCGTEQSESGWWLDVMNGHILCEKCLSDKSKGAPILPPTNTCPFLRRSASASRNFPVRVVEVVLPSLPVTAKVVLSVSSKNSSISEVSSLPLFRA